MEASSSKGLMNFFKQICFYINSINVLLASIFKCLAYAKYHLECLYALSNYETGITVILILQMGKLRLREIRELVQSNAGIKGRNQTWNPGQLEAKVYALDSSG